MERPAHGSGESAAEGDWPWQVCSFPLPPTSALSQRMRTLWLGTDQLLRDTRQISAEDYPMNRLDEVENPTLAGRALPWTLDAHPIIKPVTV